MRRFWKIRRSGIIEEEILSEKEYEGLRVLGEVIERSVLPNGQFREKIRLKTDDGYSIITATSFKKPKEKLTEKPKITNPNAKDEMIVIGLIIVLLFIAGFLISAKEEPKQPQKYKYTVTIDTDKEKIILKTNKAKVRKVYKEDEGIGGYIPYLLWFL